MELVNYYSSMIILLLVGSLPHSFTQQREDEHFDKDGRHNDEYDHKTFLGGSQQNEFEHLSPEEKLKRLGKMVDKIDKNRDGNISESELTNWIKYISLKELTKSSNQVFQKHYSRAIKDDGLVSWEEFININFQIPSEGHSEDVEKRIEQNRKRFEAADENKDGKLSLEEFVAFEYPQLFPRMHGVAASEILEDKDSDKDGIVTLVDLLKDSPYPENDVKLEFIQRDSNHDGHLEKSEIQEWFFPSTYDDNENEAKHLMRRADADKNGNLTKKEILENYEVFVGSKATHWGHSLKRPSDEL